MNRIRIKLASSRLALGFPFLGEHLVVRKSCVAALALWAAINASGRADIFCWDNGQVIPGTEGIKPGPDVDLSDWNSDSHNLSFANLMSLDLRGADFQRTTLTNADLSAATMTGATFANASIGGAKFNRVWDGRSRGTGITPQQIVATASYLAYNLTGIELRANDLTGTSLRGQDLTNAILQSANLTGVDFTDAIIESGNLSSDTFTLAQLYSTASYKAKHLRQINFSANNMTGADLSGQNLASTNLFGSTLTNADVSGSSLAGADLSMSASMQVNFTDSDLRSVSFLGANLTGANLTGASIEGAILSGKWNGMLTKEQLYTTESYQSRRLREVVLASLPRLGTGFIDLSDWDFNGQDLSGAILGGSMRATILTNANLNAAGVSGDLTDANLLDANLKGANLAGATGIENAKFNSRTDFNQWTVFPEGFDPDGAGLNRVESAVGDFDGNGRLDADDIDSLSRVLFGNDTFVAPRDMYDIDGNHFVTHNDLVEFVHDHMQTWLGDANLDGEFNSSDLVLVLSAGKYEVPAALVSSSFLTRYPIIPAARWVTGDWNADGGFNMTDLVTAFQYGGYEEGRRPVAAAPEPGGVILLAIGLSGMLWSRRVR